MKVGSIPAWFALIVLLSLSLSPSVLVAIAVSVAKYKNGKEMRECDL
jgi:hypothetical protein